MRGSFHKVLAVAGGTCAVQPRFVRAVSERVGPAGVQDNSDASGGLRETCH